jgi:hypothetical protein
MSTTLSAAYVQQTACTVRVTVGAVVRDWSIAAGTTFASAEAALVLWKANLDAAATWTLTITADSTGSGKLTLIRSTMGVAGIAWSHSGDGSALATWLGGTPAGNGGPTPLTLPGYVLGWCTCTPGAQRLRRASTSRQRSALTVLSGKSRTQHATGAEVADAVTWDAQLWMAAAERAGFESFLLGLAALASGEAFTLTHGATSELVGFADDGRSALECSQVHGPPAKLWQVGLSVRRVEL